ncbi:peroxide stress protein YaaA [Tessaracoccus sp. OH4464_COT-324]|uniref:peroxide stress protein YaaA n=1 Tax=Tessaracoccus sp. OH4464_COT-324 TaxID=2491059 RepID=UPI000F6304B0|nr:peroxide stress protein YaaA [Tessaracoccus sp. OH4464_COT-324]RRD46107.1 peroxide stress protein YaaA [Tessaracoccus sp. OH4464_COT-324]
MLCVLSPAKSLDFDTALPTKKHTIARLLDATDGVVEVLRTKSAAELRQLMSISEELATLNVERFRAYAPEHTPENSRPAMFAFAGDVYQGMAPHSFDARDLTDAQKTVRILSGMYGLLRPLDLVQPHRLEMGTKLVTSRGRTLYDWWGTSVTEMLRRDVSASPGPDVLVNLASAEYAKVIHDDVLGLRVISPRFEEESKGARRVVSFHAKRARGAFAGWLVRSRVRSVGSIVDFAELGYRYDERASTKDQPVFVR